MIGDRPFRIAPQVQLHLLAFPVLPETFENGLGREPLMHEEWQRRDVERQPLGFSRPHELRIERRVVAILLWRLFLLEERLGSDFWTAGDVGSWMRVRFGSRTRRGRLRRAGLSGRGRFSLRAWERTGASGPPVGSLMRISGIAPAVARRFPSRATPPTQDRQAPQPFSMGTGS